MLRSIATLPVLTLLAGCGIPVSDRCEVVSSETLADTDVRGGWSPAEIFALTQRGSPGSVSYAEPVGGQSPLTLVFTRRGPGRYTTYRQAPPQDPNFHCIPDVRVPVSITLRTQDGRLNESVDADLVPATIATIPSRLVTWQVQRVLHGSLRAHDFDHDGWIANEDPIALTGATGAAGNRGNGSFTICKGHHDGPPCTSLNAFTWGVECTMDADCPVGLSCVSGECSYR